MPTFAFQHSGSLSSIYSTCARICSTSPTCAKPFYTCSHLSCCSTSTLLMTVDLLHYSWISMFCGHNTQFFFRFTGGPLSSGWHLDSSYQDHLSYRENLATRIRELRVGARLSSHALRAGLYTETTYALYNVNKLYSFSYKLIWPLWAYCINKFLPALPQRKAMAYFLPTKISFRIQLLTRLDDGAVRKHRCSSTACLAKFCTALLRFLKLWSYSALIFLFTSMDS